MPDMPNINDAQETALKQVSKSIDCLTLLSVSKHKYRFVSIFMYVIVE